MNKPMKIKVYVPQGYFEVEVFSEWKPHIEIDTGEDTFYYMVEQDGSITGVAEFLERVVRSIKSDKAKVKAK